MHDGNVDAYKYLGMLEGDEIKHTEVNRRIEKEYFRRVRKILKSKLQMVGIWSKKSILGQWQQCDKRQE